MWDTDETNIKCIGQWARNVHKHTHTLFMVQSQNTEKNEGDFVGAAVAYTLNIWYILIVCLLCMYSNYI